MRLGIHTSKSLDPLAQRSRALVSGWTSFQTMVGNPRSLTVPEDIRLRVKQPVEPQWFWHAAYIAHVSPSEKAASKTSEYLSGLIQNAPSHNISAIVVHTGATSGLDVCEVIENIFYFLNTFSILDLLEAYEVKLAIEIAANVSNFNSHPLTFIQTLKGYPQLGWCLDLAHSYAAGITWPNLQQLIDEHPPLVCHCNFPGSEAASGHDIHGWRTTPGLVQRGRTMGVRPLGETTKLVERWDETVRLLRAKDVPLIIEGSGFDTSTVETELNVIREIMK